MSDGHVRAPALPSMSFSVPGGADPLGDHILANVHVGCWSFGLVGDQLRSVHVGHTSEAALAVWVVAAARVAVGASDTPRSFREPLVDAHGQAVPHVYRGDS